MVSLAGCDDENLAFNEETIEIEKNKTINLNDYVNVENATLQNYEDAINEYLNEYVTDAE